MPPKTSSAALLLLTCAVAAAAAATPDQTVAVAVRRARLLAPRADPVRTERRKAGRKRAEKAAKLEEMRRAERAAAESENGAAESAVEHRAARHHHTPAQQAAIDLAEAVKEDTAEKRKKRKEKKEKKEDKEDKDKEEEEEKEKKKEEEEDKAEGEEATEVKDATEDASSSVKQDPRFGENTVVINLDAAVAGRNQQPRDKKKTRFEQPRAAAPTVPRAPRHATKAPSTASSKKSKQHKRPEPKASKADKSGKASGASAADASKSGKTRGPTAAPTRRQRPQHPTRGPAEAATFIRMTIPGTLTLQRFNANEATMEVLRQTILKEAQDGLDEETQRATGVLFESPFESTRTIDEDGIVTYDLVVEEPCEQSCQEQAEATTMYDAVTAHMADAIESGGFTRTLRAFAEECDAEDCEGARGTSVEDGTFGDGEIEVITASGSPTETTTPTMVGSTAPTTPTFLPPDALYYTGFETGQFPDGPAWSRKSSLCAAWPFEYQSSSMLQKYLALRDADDADFRAGTVPRDAPAGRGRRLQEGEEENDCGYWTVDREEAATGAYALASPDLTNDAKEPAASAVAYTTQGEWPAGIVTFAALWDINWPGSDLSWYVDGVFYAYVTENVAVQWEEFKIYLEAGSHVVTWEFLYNPTNVEDPPQAGVAFLDDVSFTPYDWTHTPTADGTGASTEFPTWAPTIPSTKSPTKSPTIPGTKSPTKSPTIPDMKSPTRSPTRSPTKSPTTPEDTIAPTLVPPDAAYYESFEQGTFPDDPEWSVDTSDSDGPAGMQAQRARSRGASFRSESADGGRFHGADRVRRRRLAGEEEGSRHWALSKEEADTGVYSLISPDLESEDKTPMFARTTLSTEPDWGGGILKFSLLWDVNYPGSDLLWYIDGDFSGFVLNDSTEFWEQYDVYLEPGPHRVTWEFQYNPWNFEEPPPQGVAFLDSIYFVPGATLSPSGSPGNPTMYPAMPPTPGVEGSCQTGPCDCSTFPTISGIPNYCNNFTPDRDYFCDKCCLAADCVIPRSVD